MRRHCIPARADWRDRAAALNFDFHTIDDAPYWDETVYWEFSADEIDTIEDAADELHALCLQAVEQVIANDWLEPLGMRGLAAELVRESWRRRDPAFYGRFDLAWTGDGPPKLLEYNADTPTSLFEASAIQWDWLEDFAPQADQFNSLHEALVERWQHLYRAGALSGPLHLTCATPHIEDEGTVRYLHATALAAGLAAKFLPIADIGWDGRSFVDLDDQPITTLFKLYPWEWLVNEPFAAHLAPAGLALIEPAWKMVLSNKGLLAVLWHLFPGHPNLLPAAFDRAGLAAGRVVRKPLFSREGANVTIQDGPWVTASVDGPYGAEGWVWQEWAPLAGAGTVTAVLGAWMVGDKCHGLGIREDEGPITRDTSRFVPHLFR